MPGGALEVPGGTEVFPLVNAMIEKFECVVMSQDWHPPAHSSFASQHEGKAPYDVTSMPYGKQTLWPDHCVQGTSGCVTRVGFFHLPERVSRASTTPRASPSPVLPRSRPARPNPARRPSFARATRALDPKSSPLDSRDAVWMSTTTSFDVASVSRASSVPRLARVPTPPDSPILLTTRPSPTAPGFTRISPFPSARGCAARVSANTWTRTARFSRMTTSPPRASRRTSNPRGSSASSSSAWRTIFACDIRARTPRRLGSNPCW